MDMYRYVYSVRNIELTLDRNYTMDDGVCSYFTIIHDFINRRFPIITMGIELDDDMIQKYFEHRDEAKIKFDIYEQQLGEDDKPITTRLFMQNTFSIISAKDQTAYITRPDTASKKIIDDMRTLQLFDMYLIDMDMVNKFNQNMSFILNGVSKAAILQSFFEARDIPPGVVIATPPMNDSQYESISIPLGSLIDNINSMNTGYGLYDYSTMVYYDARNIYCINQMDPNITIKSPTEFGNVTFIVLSEDDPEHNVVGSNDDLATKTHYINIQEAPTVINRGDKTLSTNFSTLITIDGGGAVDKDTVDKNVTKAEYIHAYHELTAAQVKNVKLDSKIVTLQTNSCGISFLRPWKTFTFDTATQFSDLGLDKGIYRINGYSVQMVRDSHKRFTHSVIITLREITQKKIKQ